MKEIVSRNTNVDLLRAIGLLLIILAHVNAPDIIKQIRCFDVPMMLFISGLCGAKKSSFPYLSVVWKRVKRLIIPVWLFLFLYIPVLYLFQSLDIIPSIVDLEYIFDSFFLNRNGGVGYVWIIRIFILITIVSPFLVSIVNKINNAASLLFVIIIGLISLEVFFQYFSRFNRGYSQSFIYEFIMPIIAYSIPYIIGMFCTMDKKISLKKTASVIVLLGIYVLFINLLTDSFSINSFKYPPRALYVAYGALMSVFLWSCLNRQNKQIKFLLFIGRNTIWIYLYHIPFTLFANQFISIWCLQYLFIFFFSLSSFYLQYRFVKNSSHQFVKKYLVG